MMKKILVGSIFAVLLMLSLPIVPTISADNSIIEDNKDCPCTNSEPLDLPICKCLSEKFDYYLLHAPLIAGVFLLAGMLLFCDFANLGPM